MRIVWKTRVYSRNFVSDFGADLKNIVGGRLWTYERMIDVAVKECSDELLAEHPLVRDVTMQLSEFTNKSVAVVLYGVVD